MRFVYFFLLTIFLSYNSYAQTSDIISVEVFLESKYRVDCGIYVLDKESEIEYIRTSCLDLDIEKEEHLNINFAINKTLEKYLNKGYEIIATSNKGYMSYILRKAIKD